MPRYELDDGDVRRFWDITREGRRITIRTGDLGTEGRVRSKDHRNDSAAQEEMRRAVRAMTRLGYAEVREVREDEVSDPLRAAMERAPGALEVLADWLQETDDPWGPVLAAGLSGSDLREERDALTASWFPSPEVEASWAEGRVIEVRVDCPFPTNHSALVRFFQTPAGRMLQRLHLNGFAGESVLEALVENGPLQGISELVLSEALLDLPTFVPDLQALRHLELRDGTLALGAPTLPRLETLLLDYALGVDPENLRQLRHAHLPALRRLRLAGAGTGLPLGDALAAVLGRSPGLTHLELQHTRATGLLATWLPHAPESLAQLELVDAHLDDRDGEALLRALGSRLLRVRADPNRFSPPLIDALEGWESVEMIPALAPPELYEEIVE